MPKGAPLEIEVVGANKLDALARRLKAAGEEGKGLRRKLLKEIRTSSKPLAQSVKRSAEATLPRRGGLAALRAKGVSVRTRASGANAGVRLIGKATGDRLDQGDLRHPVFGNRNKWVRQSVRPGWFTRPATEGADTVREGIVRAIDDIARQVEG